MFLAVDTVYGYKKQSIVENRNGNKKLIDKLQKNSNSDIPIIVREEKYFPLVLMYRKFNISN